MKATVSDGLVLIERHEEVGKRDIIQCGGKGLSINLASGGAVGGKGEVEGALREDCIL